MGCGSSQQNTATEEAAQTEKTNEAEKHSAKIKSNARVYPTNTTVIRVESAQKSHTTPDKGKENVKTTQPEPGNDSAVASRNSSAVSSSSQKSAADSGVDEPHTLDIDNRKDDASKEMSNLFVSRGPSGKVRSVDEAEIIEKLRNEGLISRPKSVASGMSFEIAVGASILDEKLPPISMNPNRRLPPRLQRLEQVKEEKVVTEDDIKNKLAKAAERRRKKREAKLAKPPRPATRMSIAESAVSDGDSTAMTEVPLVRTSHPETETLRPPTMVHFEDLSATTETN